MALVNFIWPWSECGRRCGHGLTMKSDEHAVWDQTTDAFFGLPLIEVEDLTNNGPADNGTTMPHIPLALPAPLLNGSQHR